MNSKLFQTKENSFSYICKRCLTQSKHKLKCVFCKWEMLLFTNFHDVIEFKEEVQSHMIRYLLFRLEQFNCVTKTVLAFEMLDAYPLFVI